MLPGVRRVRQLAGGERAAAGRPAKAFKRTQPGQVQHVALRMAAAAVGVPPMQYLEQWRMQAAARLLLDTRATVAAIALDARIEHGALDRYRRRKD